MPRSFGDLFDDSNRALFAFLQTEVKLGFTFGGMAKAYRDEANGERYEVNRRNATAADCTVSSPSIV